jgi:transketolase
MTERATRDAYGRALLDLGETIPELVVLDADLSRSTRTDWFAERYPTRFFNVGIAEQNMIGIAAGMALIGLTPFATTYAIFVSRAVDQIRQAVCYAGANVKIVATHAGLSASYDGGSHQGTEDVAHMRVMPGMTILCPADYDETYAAVVAAAEVRGPVYLRIQKEPVPDLSGCPGTFTIGRARLLRDGEDVAIITAGSLASRALLAAESLAATGLSTRVLQLSTLKPVDVDALRDTARRCRVIVTAEEHSLIGGLHEAVVCAVKEVASVKVVGLGLDDRFGETGSWHGLLAKLGLDERSMCAAARRALEDAITATQASGAERA